VGGRARHDPRQPAQADLLDSGRSGFPVYTVHALLLYFLRDQIEQMGADPSILPGQQTIFRDTLWRGLTWTWLPLFLVALVAGSGSLAADNRANALLVYLSKPITKTDYLVGKWAGVFVLLAGVSVAPAVLTFLFLFAAYNSEGFLQNNPWLFPRLLGATLLPALLHTSIVIGISAWSKSPRVVGATYAGLFFVTLIVSDAAGYIFLNNLPKNDPDADTRPALLAQSLSVPGLVNNVGLHLYRVDPTLLGQQRRSPSSKPQRRPAPAAAR
jgi:ABC-type transport system involved in multi-copper enzyme maturation permease subunit